MAAWRIQNPKRTRAKSGASGKAGSGSAGDLEVRLRGHHSVDTVWMYSDMMDKRNAACLQALRLALDSQKSAASQIRSQAGSVVAIL